MSVWRQNCQGLRARTLHPAAWPFPSDEPPSDPGPGSCLPDRRGTWVPSWRGRALQSLYDSETEAQRWVESQDPAPEPAAVVLAGLGNGAFVAAALRRWPDRPIVVWEPWPASLTPLLQSLNLESLLAQTGWSIHWGLDVQPLLEALKDAPAPWTFHIWRAWEEEAPGLFAPLRRQAEERSKWAQVNRNTLARFAPLWLKHFFRNLSSRRGRSLAPWAQAAAGRPAVICAAGPSLESWLAPLAQKRGDLVLIAVDTAYEVLRAAGLEPDFLVFMDSQYWNARHVRGPLGSDVQVVAELASHPWAFEVSPRGPLVTASTFPFLRDLEAPGLPPLASGGSVSTMAWSLGQFLGCSPLLMAGLDLSYPAELSHVRGSQFPEQAFRTGTRLRPALQSLRRLTESAPPLFVPGRQRGRQVRSDHRLELYRQWFSYQAALNPAGLTWLLGTEGAAIPGLELWPHPDLQALPAWTGPRPSPQGPFACPAWAEAPRERLQRGLLTWQGRLAWPGPLARDWPETWKAHGRAWGRSQPHPEDRQLWTQIFETAHSSFFSPPTI